MSGGVDSSVAAALLQEAGHDVVGVFMKFWAEAGGQGQNKCCSSESERRARGVAKILGIPFYVFNFEKEIKKKIVDSFLKENRLGVTPNPCVVCNKEIKFGLLLERADKIKADFLASGHYARIKKDGQGMHLLKAKDENKDQSYFLWKLTQAQLKHVLFPLEKMTRPEVEKLAVRFALPFAGVRKSMEVCFIPATAADFLKRHIKTRPGKIVDNQGKIIGRHEGLSLYTVGQRKGMNLGGGPYYVLGKDLKKNLLFITKNEKDLFKKELVVKSVNWILGKEPKLPLKAMVKIRYRQEPSGATITKNKVYRLKFTRPQRAVTPGQSAVFYRGQELLGGGIIIK